MCGDYLFLLSCTTSTSVYTSAQITPQAIPEKMNSPMLIIVPSLEEYAVYTCYTMAKAVEYEPPIAVPDCGVPRVSVPDLFQL